MSQSAVIDHTSPSVLVAIVNYRTGSLVCQGLEALADERARYAGRLQAVVVDNASGDDSASVIEACVQSRGWGDWVRVVRSSINGGFSFGNNLALRTSVDAGFRPDLVWLLNPDTRVKPGAAGALVDFLARNPRAGICGSSFEFGDGRPWTVAFRFPSVLGEFENGMRFRWVSRLLEGHAVARTMGEEPARVDWVAGASMMVRRSVFDTAGPMDEGYFLYYEETDFCLAARRAGFECWYVPASRVIHDPGQSSGITDESQRNRRLPRYWYESRRRYFVKNHGRFYAALADLAWASGFATWRLRRRLLNKPDLDPARQLSDTLLRGALLNGGMPGNCMLEGRGTR